MTPKEPSKTGSPKSELLEELSSLKSTLDEDDDNVPLLLDDEEDVPVLGEADDDIPILDTVDTRAQQATDKASLEAALKQLESMELAPRSRKAEPAQQEPKSIEDKIRANAAAPLIKQEELTRVRENPFLNQNQKAQLELNRKLREEAKKMAEIAALSKPRGAAPAPPPPPPMEESVIEFTDNPFLKASTTPAASATPASVAAGKEMTEAEEEDGSAAILKELEEDLPLATRKSVETADDTFGDIILTEEQPAPVAAHPASGPAGVDALIDEVIEEYLVVLETALRKKLKEKLPDLLKK